MGNALRARRELEARKLDIYCVECQAKSRHEEHILATDEAC